MKKPTPQEVEEYAKSIDFGLDGEAFCDFYMSKGWLIGKSPMKNWEAAVRTWKRMDKKTGVERNCIRCQINFGIADREDATGQKYYLCESCK